MNSIRLAMSKELFWQKAYLAALVGGQSNQAAYATANEALLNYRTEWNRFDDEDSDKATRELREEARHEP